MKLNKLLPLFFGVAYAVPSLSLSEGIGDVAGNIMIPVTIVSQFMAEASIIIGMTCLFASFIRYFQHRKNPLAHPISTVITLFLVGASLLILPYIYQLTESGIPFK